MSIGAAVNKTIIKVADSRRVIEHLAKVGMLTADKVYRDGKGCGLSALMPDTVCILTRIPGCGLIVVVLGNAPGTGRWTRP